ncbi:MAG: hypothetical protein VKO44_11615 [Cyanobacteriota bacterium]|jgi:hypothetical protein|nr:hypothetical protein [Cyanobacteriota bacterium]
MSAVPDRHYNAACGRLASWLGVSIASARRRVDIRASKEGLRDTAARIELAERMLAEAQASGVDNQALLEAQLGALDSEADFMTED